MVTNLVTNRMVTFLMALSHLTLSHAKLIQWTINEEMEPGTKIIIDLPQELGLDRRPEGYIFKVRYSLKK